MSETEMREVIRKAVGAVGSLRQAAKAWGVSPAYLSDCLNGRRAPGPSVLAPLGYERVVSVSYLRTPEATT